jgi:hypothetical protein
MELPGGKGLGAPMPGAGEPIANLEARLYPYSFVHSS